MKAFIPVLLILNHPGDCSQYFGFIWELIIDTGIVYYGT